MTKVILFYNGVTIKSAANRSMLEQTWGEFAQILTYKAEGCRCVCGARRSRVYLADVQQMWSLRSLMRRNKRGTGARQFGSGVLIVATTSIEASMPRRTYWRADWHSRFSLRENQRSQGAPIWKK